MSGLTNPLRKEMKHIKILIAFSFVCFLLFAYAIVDYAKEHKGTFLSDEVFIEMPINGVVSETFRADHNTFYVRFIEDQYLFYRHINGKYEGIIAPGDSVYKEEKWDYMIIKTREGDIKITVNSEWE